MILNIAGYQFVTLSDLVLLREQLLSQCNQLQLKGTILLSHEGININLAGIDSNILAFKHFLSHDHRFNQISFHEASSLDLPFKKLKIKIKKEIITMRQSSINVVSSRAPTIPPQALKQWLDEKRDITLLDTRNDYEIDLGTFNQAVNLHLSDFSEFPVALSAIDQDKPIVMFCTGGIRCEKAALYMIQQGYKAVYQLDGGILGYFASVGSDYYQGGCFVFDERMSVNAENYKMRSGFNDNNLMK